MKTRIYTPQETKQNPFDGFKVGDLVLVTIKHSGTMYFGCVHSFPTHSWRDTESRICILPVDGVSNWFGILTISDTVNDYAQYHISEVTISKL